MKKNSIEYWLNKIPNEEIKQKALKNWKKQGKRSILCYNMYSALICAFRFINTPEGHDYWWDIYMKLSNGQPLQSTPTINPGSVWRHKSPNDKYDTSDKLILGVTDDVVYFSWIDYSNNDNLIHFGMCIEHFTDMFQKIQD